MSNGQDSTIQYSLVSTALGWVGVLVSPKGIRCLSLPQPTPDMTLQYLQWSKPVDLVEATAGSFPNIERRLEQYFGGEETTFDDSLDLVGTAFQKKVWEVALTIPWGETRSYGWLALAAGRPGAARAAGQAMARNRLAPLVPCHRVVGGDGSLHGYG
ncbi:MAG: methylated-DNA--[protein]-cysteine S-methyltransferase, partial [Dehalococcoidia bacterium]|nr:methylated-DNA--[protein]-cysteine S-methyltransferase [Dehalococcoidia bacterium]